MHTLLTILAGLVLMTLFMGVARLIIYNKARVYRLAFWVFTLLWTAVAIINTWMDARTGSMVQELPVFMAVLLIPVMSAYIVQRRMRTAVETTGR